MNDHDALLAAILADPANDTLRLVYADWLDEAGDHDRAEFIRVQVELAKADDSWVPPGGGSPAKARDALRRRERELLHTRDSGGYDNHYRWSDLDGVTAVHDFATDWEYRRGFVAELSCTAADWDRHADAVRACQPVERVTLTMPPLVLDLPAEVTATFAAGTTVTLGEILLAAYRLKWPGIEFTLPEVVFAPPAQGQTAT